MKRFLSRLLASCTQSRTDRRPLSRQRAAHLEIESLERRELLSAAPLAVLPIVHRPSPSALADRPTADAASSFPGGGYTVNQLRTAYGINGITFGSTTGTGKGQTVAIIDATNDPNIVSDLDTFDQNMSVLGSGPTLFTQFGSASSFLKVFDQNGNLITPATNTSVPQDTSGADAGETTLDVEWVHAIAPGANIVLVEVNSLASNDLFQGVATAAKMPAVSVVSMSFGIGESGMSASQVASLERETVRRHLPHAERPSRRDLRGEYGRQWLDQLRLPGLFAQRAGGRRHDAESERQQFDPK